MGTYLTFHIFQAASLKLDNPQGVWSDPNQKGLTGRNKIQMICRLHPGLVFFKLKEASLIETCVKSLFCPTLKV